MVFKTKYNVIFVADEATATFIEEFFFFFLQSYLRHMEVPELGIKLEL